MKTLINLKNSLVNSITAHKAKLILVLGICLMTQNACRKENCSYDDDAYPPDCIKGMDVVFAIDYTGSMGGAINNIKSAIGNIVNTIVTKSGGNYRLGLAIFDEQSKANVPAYFGQTAYTSLPAANRLTISTGPTTNQYLTVMENFANANIATFSTQLGKLNGAMSMGNGVSLPEPGDLLIDKLVASSLAGTWRPNVAKLIIIVTDAPASGDDDTASGADDANLTSIATSANSAGIQCILISSQATNNYETKLIANNIGGIKLMSANFSNIAPDIITMINNLCDNNAKP